MESKSTYSEVYEQISKDLPIISILKQMDNNFIDKSLLLNSEKYLDILSKSYVVFDINPKDMSPIEQLIAICDKLTLLSDKFELKRTNQLMDKSLEELRSDVFSLNEKNNDSMKQMKSQSSFESKISDKIKFYTNKFKEYYDSVKTKENTLSKIGFTSHLKQESIQQIRDKNEELRIRLKDVNSRLNEYKDFRPTETDLKNRINDMKFELSELDHIFNKL